MSDFLASSVIADTTLNVTPFGKDSKPNFILLPSNGQKNIAAYNVYSMGLNPAFQPFNKLNAFLDQSKQFDAYTIASTSIGAFLVTAPIFVQFQVIGTELEFLFAYPEKEDDVTGYNPFDPVKYIASQTQLGPQNNTVISVDLWMPCIQDYEVTEGTNKVKYNQMVAFELGQAFSKAIYFYTAVDPKQQNYLVNIAGLSPDQVEFIPLNFQATSQDPKNLFDGQDKLIFVFMKITTDQPTNAFFLYNPELYEIPQEIFRKLVALIEDPKLGAGISQTPSVSPYSFGLLLFSQLNNQLSEPTACISGFRNNLAERTNPLLCPGQSYQPTTNIKTTDCSQTPFPAPQSCVYCPPSGS